MMKPNSKWESHAYTLQSEPNNHSHRKLNNTVAWHGCSMHTWITPHGMAAACTSESHRFEQTFTSTVSGIKWFHRMQTLLAVLTESILSSLYSIHTIFTVFSPHYRKSTLSWLYSIHTNIGSQFYISFFFSVNAIFTWMLIHNLLYYYNPHQIRIRFRSSVLFYRDQLSWTGTWNRLSFIFISLALP